MMRRRRYTAKTGTHTYRYVCAMCVNTKYHMYIDMCVLITIYVYLLYVCMHIDADMCIKPVTINVRWQI